MADPAEFAAGGDGGDHRCGVGFDLYGVGESGFPDVPHSCGSGSAADGRSGRFSVSAGDWGGDVFPVYESEPGAGAACRRSWMRRGRFSGGWCRRRCRRSTGYEVEAAYFPAEEVGGDFYQVLESKGGAKLVVVGDVSGKGLKAAMTGTLAMGALRALATEGLGPGALLMRLNRQLLETSDEGFVTCICARVEPEGRRDGGERRASAAVSQRRGIAAGA